MKNWGKWISLIILSILIIYSQFYKLGYLPFRIWDETRLATSAYEMTKSGNLIVTTISNIPDLWNTKPPMMIWVQALSIKLLGLSEFSVRLPSAICAALITLMVFCFVSKITRNTWSGLASAMVLCTTPGFLIYHAVRNGEYDSMLTLFTTAYLVSIYLYTETRGPRQNIWLMLFFLFLTCGVLTKGIAAMLFAPAIFIYVLYSKQMLSLISNKYFYLGIFFFLIFVLGYYGLRELENPGYLKAVADNELGGRFMATNENHIGPWDFYWDYLRTDGFGVWYWIIPTSLLAIWFYPDRKLFRAAAFFLFSATLFIIILSISQTKLSWYAIPTFPLLAIAVGIFVHQICNIAQQILSINKKWLTVLLVFILSLQPVPEAYKAIKFQWDDLAKDNFYAASYYFRDGIKGSKNLNGTIYLSCGYNLQWCLYVKWLNEIGVHIEDHPYLDGNKFKPGDKLIANQREMKDYIEKNYDFKLIEEFYGLKNYLIISAK